jgi:rRNA-processing protein FCF1
MKVDVMKGKKGAQPVIIDTNAMILQVEYRIDFEKELMGLLGSYEIFIPITVLNELNGIKDKHAKAALKLAQKYQNVESVKSGDDAIVSLALKLNAIVITNDRALRKRLLEQGKSVIYVRQRAYLAMDVP